METLAQRIRLALSIAGALFVVALLTDLVDASYESETQAGEEYGIGGSRAGCIYGYKEITSK